MNTFTWIFLIFLAATLGMKLWLGIRQRRHVLAHRDRVPEAFAQNISLGAHQKAADYVVEKSRFGSLELIISEGLALLAFTLGGGLNWLDRLATTLVGTSPYWHGLAVLFGLMIVSAIISLPFDIYRTFSIEARHGFNRTSWGTFVGDLIKGAILGAALGTPLILGVIWFFLHTGGAWWIWTWALWTAFMFLMMWAYPRFIAPFFNKFTPLEGGEVRSRIESLMQRCGFAANGLFVMDGSKRSSHGNAYFTGFGKTKRIVFFDTLLSQLSPEEIEAVLAHELGHFKRGHVPKLMTMQVALTFVLLAVLGWVFDKPWFYEGLGVATPGVGVGLALFFLVIGVFTFPLTPLASLLSRKNEFEADEFAAQQTSSKYLVSALVKLYRDNASTLTPDPIHSLVYDSHPPAAIRIAALERLGTQAA